MSAARVSTASMSAADFAPLFAALGDPTRLGLVETLADGRHHSIAELTGDHRMTRQAVTKHLKVLESVGVISSIRVGREVLFGYQPDQLQAAAQRLASISRQWEDALGRLKAFLED